MRTHGAVVGRRFRSITKLTTKVRIGGRGYLWGSFLIAAAALKTPTRNGYNAQGVNLKFYEHVDLEWYVSMSYYSWPLQDILLHRGFRARINHPFIPRCHLHCPSWCNTIARLLGSIRPPRRPPVYMPYTTLLVTTISCKGQYYRVHQAEYVIHILLAASQEYVSTYSTCRGGDGRAVASAGGNPGLTLEYLIVCLQSSG